MFAVAPLLARKFVMQKVSSNPFLMRWESGINSLAFYDGVMARHAALAVEDEGSDGENTE